MAEAATPENSIAREHARIAKAAFLAMNAGDVEQLNEFYAPELRVHLPRSAPAFADGSTRADRVEDVMPHIGRDGFFEAISKSHALTFKVAEPEIIHVIADEENAVVFINLHAVLHNGNRYDNTYSFHMRFRDGKIVEQWDLFDTAYAESVFPRPPAAS
jgi:ketosteroid isomerase-like protein